MAQDEFRFDGDDYQPERDDARLNTQIHRIWALMIDGEWRTLEDISKRTGAPQPSALAQLGHMRKTRFGSHQTPKRKVLDRNGEFGGLYQYRLIPNPEHPELVVQPDTRPPSKMKLALARIAELEEWVRGAHHHTGCSGGHVGNYQCNCGRRELLEEAT